MVFNKCKRKNGIEIVLEKILLLLSYEYEHFVVVEGMHLNVFSAMPGRDRGRDERNDSRK